MAPFRQALARALLILLLLSLFLYLTLDLWGSYFYVYILRSNVPSQCSLPMPLDARPDLDLEQKDMYKLTWEKRLEKLLDASPDFLSLADVRAIEQRLKFYIMRNHKIAVTFSWGGVLPHTMNLKQCPSCEFDLELAYAPSTRTNRDFEHIRHTEAHMYYTCLSRVPYRLPLTHQPLFCHCGEADPEYDTYWRQYCDVNMDQKGDLPTSWYRRSYALPEWNIEKVSDFVEHILQPPPIRDPRRVSIFVQSNCHTRSGREHWIWGMSKYGAVDSLGPCLNNSNECSKPLETLPRGEEYVVKRDQIKVAQIHDYHFGSALENTVYDYYITEKRWHVWAAQSVPIVFGAKDAKWSRDSTPGDNSAVFVDDFSGPKELSEYLIRTVNDREEYLKYFDWQCKGIRKEFARQLFLGMDDHACRVCERLEVIQDAFEGENIEFISKSFPLRGFSKFYEFGIHNVQAWIVELVNFGVLIVVFSLLCLLDRRVNLHFRRKRST